MVHHLARLCKVCIHNTERHRLFSHFCGDEVLRGSPHSRLSRSEFRVRAMIINIRSVTLAYIIRASLAVFPFRLFSIVRESTCRYSAGRFQRDEENCIYIYRKSICRGKTGENAVFFNPFNIDMNYCLLDMYARACLCAFVTRFVKIFDATVRVLL